MKLYTTETKCDSKSQSTLLNYEKSTHSIFVKKQITRNELMFYTSRSSNNHCAYDPLDLDLSENMKSQFMKLGMSKDMEDMVMDLLEEWVMDNKLPTESKMETSYNRELEIEKVMECYF